MSATRKLMHFVIAIVLTAFVCGIIVALPPFYPPALQYPEIAFGVLLTGWLFSIPFVGVGGLLIGLPISFAMNSMKLAGYVKWAVAGALAGALFSLLVTFVFGGRPPSGADELVWGWLGVAPGIAAGLYWWGMVARQEQLQDSVV